MLLPAALLTAVVTALADLFLPPGAIAPVAVITPAVAATLCFRLAGRPGRRGLFRLALFGFALLASLALAEAGFRTLLLKPLVPSTANRFQESIAAGWPRPVLEAKPPGTWRILGLADSFGRAGGAHNYHYLVEANLKRQGWRVDLVNLSLRSTGPEDQVEILQRFAARFQPDLILHGFFVGNDFVADRGPVMDVLGIPLRAPSGWAALRPRDMVSARWWRLSLRARIHERERGEEIRRQLPSGAYTLRVFEDFGRRLMPLFEPTPPPAERWSGVAEALDALRDESRRLGAAYAMVIHPDRWQIEDDLRAEMERQFRSTGEALDLDLPQRFLTARCATQQVDCLDLTPDFRREGAAGGLYAFRDTHYDDTGNALAARRISEWIASRYDLPR